MMFEMDTDGYKILDTGLVLLPGGTADLKMHIVASEKFDFYLELIFKKTSDKKRKIEQNTCTNEQKIQFICTNFEEEGAGTIEALDLATVDNRKVKLLFWSYQPKETIRKIEYTVLIEKECKEKDGK